jgi:hypothetical protein
MLLGRIWARTTLLGQTWARTTPLGGLGRIWERNWANASKEGRWSRLRDNRGIGYNA